MQLTGSRLKRVLLVSSVFLVFQTIDVPADAYPPYYSGTGTPNPVHFEPVTWPDDSAWIGYTMRHSDQNDQRDQDPSNGGTSPQNYVNVSSAEPDQDSVSIYYAFDADALPDDPKYPERGVMFFRWRVQSTPHTYAIGPHAGAYSTSDPWRSALWTVLIDIDADGYREFAVQLDGSSGEPDAAIDRLVCYYSNTPNQYLDVAYTLGHNPAAFVDDTATTILNFQNSVTPTTNWPNGSNETLWDYGTTRATLISVADGIDEYLVDYQIPLGLLDATSLNGPVVTSATPMSFSFTTSNSLQNPLQKDVVYDGAFVGDPAAAVPMGDIVTLNDGIFQQPTVTNILTAGCGPTRLTAYVMDSLYVSPSTGKVVGTLADVDFYYYFDENVNGIADDGNSWAKAADGSPTSQIGEWTGLWDATGLPQGQYLVGVQAVDDGSLNTWQYNELGYEVANRTFSYLAEADLPANDPSVTHEIYYSNPGGVGVVAIPDVNGCGVPPPFVTKTVSPDTQSAGGNVQFTLTVTNTDDTDPLSVNSITDFLPSGFEYVSTDGGTLSPTGTPTAGAVGDISWSFAPDTIAVSSTGTLIFTAKVSSTPGTYSNVASADTGEGALTCDPVQIFVGSPQLTIAKSASVTSAGEGDTIIYTITYSNNSPVSVTNVVLTDAVPDGATFDSASDGGTESGGIVTWNLPDLAAGEGPYTVTMTVTVDNPYPDAAPIPMVNTATIDSDETDPPVSASTSVFITAPRPNLAIQKDGDVLVSPGDTGVIYTLSYENVGNATATGVTVQDVVPDGFTLNATGTTAGYTESPAGTFTWSVADVAAGGAGSITVVLDVDSPFSATNPATNTATIDSNETDAVSDTFRIGVGTGGSCSTYYFHSTTINAGTGATSVRKADTTAPTATTDSTITVSTQTTYSSETASDVELMRFYEDPVATFSTTITGSPTASLWLSESGAQGAHSRLYLYDYEPSAGSETLLGTSGDQTFSGTTAQAISYTVTLVPSNPILAAGHRLLWVLMIWDQHTVQQEAVTFYYDSVNDGGGTSPDHTSQSGVCFTGPAELVIDKQVDKLSVTPTPNPPGLQTLQYTIQFTNIGGTDATGCTIVDTLPTGVTFVSATLNGTATAPDISAAPTYTWNVESSVQAVDSAIVGAGESGTLVINVTVDAPLDPSILSLQNAATFDDDDGTVAAANDTTTTSVLLPDLSIQKQVSASLLTPGETFTYTLIVTNNGQATANNLVVTDTLPVATGDINYVSNDVSAVWSSPTLTWSITSLAAGASATATVSMSVDSAPLTFSGMDTQDNTASVVSDETTSVDSNTVTVTISTNPNLSITKSVSPAAGPYAPGDELTYTLVVENIGSGDADDVQVLDVIPDDTNYSSGTMTLDGGGITDISGDDEGRFDAINDRIVFDLGTLAATATQTITFKVLVDGVMPDGDTDVVNTATVSASNTATKTASVTTTVTAAAVLELTKTGPGSIAYPVATLDGAVTSATTLVVSNAAQLSLGQVIRISSQDRTITNISGTSITVDSAVTAADGVDIYGSVTYSLIYQNTGNADATNVSLTDTLPAGVDYISASVTPNSGPNPLVWTINVFTGQELAAGASGTIAITVIPTAAGTITNNAVLSSTETGTTSASLDTGVGGVIVTKSTSTPTVVNTPSGVQVIYTIILENTLATATPADLQVTDLLFAGFSYASTTSTVFSSGSGVTPTVFPTSGDTEATWGGITINGNSTLEITFVVDVDPAVGEAVYDNEVHVESPGTPELSILQFDETLTTAENVTVSIEFADLSLTKAASDETPTAGSTVTFTLTLTNDGPDTATNVTVADQLPNGYSYVSMSGGDSQTTTGGPVGALLEWTVNSLASGSSTTLTYQAVVQTYVAGTTVYLNGAEVTDADQYDPDSTPADGTGDDFALVNASPAGQVDLSVTKTPSAGPWAVGNTVLFTITVANAGPDDAHNIAVRDILPNGYSYTTSPSAIAGGDSQSVTGGPVGATLEWTITSLVSGNSTDLTYYAVVQAQDPGVTYINTAEVIAVDENDVDSTPRDGTGDDYDEVNASPSGSADLSLSKSPSNATPLVGDTVTFTLTLANDAGSADSATNIRVEDVVPNGYAYVANSMTGGTTRNGASDPVLVWTVASLAPGAGVDLTYAAVVQTTGPGITYTNSAEVTAVDQYDPDSTPDDGAGDDYAEATASPGGTGTIAGTIYIDNNDNGSYDAGIDDPLPYVDVVITDSGGTPHTVTTDADGAYTLAVSAGVTEVNVDDGDLPGGAGLTTGDTDPASDTVNVDTTTTIDIGYVLSSGNALVQGYLYNDENENGLYDSGETPITDVNVVITADATTVTASTDANGYYRAVVPAGTAIIDVDETDPQYPAGISLTTNVNGQGSDSVTVTTVDTGSLTVYTGYVTPSGGTGTVDGRVYNDSNGDGQFNLADGDTAIANVDVIITDSTGGVYTVTTDSDGLYSVVVAAGEAVVDVDTTDADFPSGKTLTTDEYSEGSDTTTVTVTSGGTVTDNTGYVTPAGGTGTVAGRVYYDNNGDGLFNPADGDTAIANVDVIVTDSAGGVYTVTTDSDGLYSVVVAAGEAIVDVDTTDADFPSGKTLTTNANGEGSDTTTVTVLSGDTVTDNTGYITPAQSGGIDGRVYKDLDFSGTWNTGDDPIPDVDVIVTDVNGGVYVLVTDSTGYFSVVTAAPVATVDVDTDDPDFPDGWTLTKDDSDQGSDPTVIEVPTGTRASGSDYTGYVDSTGGNGTVDGRVYDDVNGNGVYDSGTDSPIPNVDVIITDANGGVYTETTDANGLFSVTVADGTATVDVDTTDADFPADRTLTTDISDEGSDVSFVTVPNGGTVTDNTGYITSTGNIGTVNGRVYDDVNQNGTYDSGTDSGLAGVEVAVTDATGGVYTVTTDADGLFSVEVAAGSGSVNVLDWSLPAGYVLTIAPDGEDPTSVTVVAGGTVTDDTGYYYTAADLSITKQSNTTNPSVGDTITFTLTVSNAGPSTATNVVVQDSLPNGYSYVGGSMSGGSSQDESAAPTLTWTINSLADSASVALTFQAVLLADGTGVSHLNQAEVTASDQYDPDSTPGDGTGDDYDSINWSFSTPVRQLTGRVSSGVAGGIDVFWSTVGEDGVVKFEIQRNSGNGYASVDEMFATGGFLGSADYAFTDRSTVVGGNYNYRIAVVNIGGGGEKYELGSAACLAAATVLPSVQEVVSATRSEVPAASVESLVYDVPEFMTGLPKQWGGGYRAEIRKTGVYTVGVPGSVYNLGCELPQLDTDKVFVRGICNFYTDANVLWYGTLTSSGVPENPPEPTVEGCWDSNGFTGVFHAEVDAKFYPNTYLPPGPNWYYPSSYDLNGGTLRTVTLDVTSPGAGTATVSVALRSDTSGAHNLTVSINGTQVGTATWDGTGHWLVQAEFDAALLKDGSNSIQLATSGTGSSKKLDYVEVTAPAEPTLRDGGLLVRVGSGASQTLTVPGATFAVNATAFAGETRLDLDNGSVSGLSEGELVYFCSVFGTPSWEAEYTTVDLPSFADVDYLAVATDDMIGELDPLLAHHEANGLTTASVSMDTVTNAYGCGIFGPGSIVSLSREVSPKYLLLAGTTTYDYLDRENLHTPVGIPVGFTHVHEGLAATDDIYSNSFATAVGRFPARSAEELAAMVAKTVSFRPASRAVLLAGEDRGTGAADRFKELQGLLTDIMPSVLIASSEAGNATLRNRLIRAINCGARLVTYQGHAGYQQLDYDALIDGDDASSIPASAWFLSTCYTGMYVVNDWSLSILVHRLLREPERGAVSVICSTRMGDMMEEHVILREALTLIANEKPTWGAVLQYLKTAWGDLETMDHYTLLGDPALQTWGENESDRELALVSPLGGEVVSTASVQVDFSALGEGWWKDAIGLYWRIAGGEWTEADSLQLDPGQGDYSFSWEPSEDSSTYQVMISEMAPSSEIVLQGMSGIFTVDQTPPTVPEGISPADSSQVCSPVAILSVSSTDVTSGVSAYEFEVDGTAGEWQEDAYFACEDLDNGLHSWRCRARDAGGLESDWCPLHTFTYVDGGDADGDDLLDEWELSHFGRLGFSDGSADSDGDGKTDREEFLAGTDPYEFHADAVAGWNLLALPCVPDDETVARLQSAFITPFWSWVGDGYEEIDTPVPFQGFWALALTDVSLTVSGLPPDSSTIELQPGWNQAGPGRESPIPQHPLIEAICRWNGSFYEYLPLATPETRLRNLEGTWMMNGGDSPISVEIPVSGETAE